MEKGIDPNLIQPILDILEYGAAFVLGIIAKWLQGRRRNRHAVNSIGYVKDAAGTNDSKGPSNWRKKGPDFRGLYKKF